MDSDPVSDVNRSACVNPGSGDVSDGHVSDDLVLDAVKSAECLACPASHEFAQFEALMLEISCLPVRTIRHIPRSVRPLLSQVLGAELRHVTDDGIWGFARLQMFPKAVLRCPPRAGKKKRYVMKALLHSRLERWLAGD